MENFNLNDYKNHVVFINLNKSNDVPYIDGKYIAFFEYVEKLKYYELNHPLEVSSSFVVSGGANFNPDDIIEIREATDEEFNLWKEKYEEFHKEVIEEKGYDFCEVNYNELIRL